MGSLIGIEKNINGKLKFLGRLGTPENSKKQYITGKHRAEMRSSKHHSAWDMILMLLMKRSREARHCW